MSAPARRQTFRFQDFELDLGAYELRRQGRRVRLERRPMDLLILLVDRRGQLVTRAEIIERLWGQDVFVEVETGIKPVVRKVRQALRDSPDSPAFVETVPGKGYRFIASVETVEEESVAPVDIPGRATRTAESVSARDTPLVSPMPAGKKRAIFRPLAIAVVAVAVIGYLAIWTWRQANPWPRRVTFAVLPFKIIGNHPEREYLAESLAEETNAALGQVEPERFVVIALSSTRRYKGTSTSVDVIGRELGADYIVESSIQEEGGRVRVRSSLIRVADQLQIWSDSCDNEPRSMLEFQSELGATIAAQIRVKLSPERLSALARRQSQDAEAYNLYLQGRSAWTQFQPASTKLAVDYYLQATKRDPNYALAWAGLADAYATSTVNGDAPPRVVGPLAREAARKAVAADPDLSETYSSQGFVNFFLD
jgi:TolB-like protein/DNA-binding winged helix-turn-helix (wHTH) protein